MLLIYSFDRRSLNVLLHGPKTSVHAHFHLKHAGCYIMWGLLAELPQSGPQGTNAVGLHLIMWQAAAPNPPPPPTPSSCDPVVYRKRRR